MENVTDEVIESYGEYLRYIGNYEDSIYVYSLIDSWDLNKIKGVCKGYLFAYLRTKNKIHLKRLLHFLEGKEIGDSSVLYYKNVALLLLNKLDSLEEINVEEETDDVFSDLAVVIKIRRDYIKEYGVDKLNDPMLIRLFVYLYDKANVTAEELSRRLVEASKYVESKEFPLKTTKDKVLAIIYFTLRGITEKEKERFLRYIKNGKVDVSLLPPYTKKIIEEYFPFYERVPFYIKKDIEILEDIAEKLYSVENVKGEEFNVYVKEIKKRLKRLVKKASLVMDETSVLEMIKLYVMGLPIDDETKDEILESVGVWS